jgi:hypothetical protein
LVTPLPSCADVLTTALHDGADGKISSNRRALVYPADQNGVVCSLSRGWRSVTVRPPHEVRAVAHERCKRLRTMSIPGALCAERELPVSSGWRHAVELRGRTARRCSVARLGRDQGSPLNTFEGWRRVRGTPGTRKIASRKLLETEAAIKSSR